MPGAEWLALPCKHIRDHYEQLVRYCGWYSSRSRGARAAKDAPAAAISSATSEVLFGSAERGSGLSIGFGRSDIGFANSQISLGTASGVVASQFSSFQFGSQIGIDFLYQTSGQIDGVVSNGSDSFNFSFDTSGIPASEMSGTNFAMSLDSGLLPNPTIDNLTISAIPEPETYALMLAGLGVLGIAARRRQRKAVQA